MFSFRRKPKAQESPIRTSPSLPHLSAQGSIPWPENFVDAAAIQEQAPEFYPQGAHRTHLAGHDGSPISFHKPFPTGKHRGPISSLYMSSPPSAFEKRKSTAGTTVSGRQSQRRARIPPSFNVMVVGKIGVGKTSLLRLLLETADVSPTATAEQRTAMKEFLHGSTLKHTESLQTTCIEICESRLDRVQFTIIDTPGLDFRENRELKLELQTNDILKYVDAQYADTMSEESKVIRKNQGDKHVHLCIYMVDPASTVAVPARARSGTTQTTPDLVSDDGSDDESETSLTMSPADVRVLRRLSQRMNILTVIGQADSLTDERLTLVKDAIRRGLAEANLDLGVFGPPAGTSPEVPRRQPTTHFENANTSSGITGSDDEEDGADRQSRGVIKLRPRNNRKISRSRSRRDLKEEAGVVDAEDVADSVANVRFSAHIVAKSDISASLPFAVIAPEPNKRRPRRLSAGSNSATTEASPQTNEPDSPSTMRNPTFLQGPPEDLKGVFTRKFRWGTVDVLDPNHCDFPALRTAILSTHFKLLKTRTKEVLYEKYRTDKLLTRRATRHLTEEDRKRAMSA